MAENNGQNTRRHAGWSYFKCMKIVLEFSQSYVVFSLSLCHFPGWQIYHFFSFFRFLVPTPNCQLMTLLPIYLTQQMETIKGTFHVYLLNCFSPFTSMLPSFCCHIWVYCPQLLSTPKNKTNKKPNSYLYSPYFFF